MVKNLHGELKLYIKETKNNGVPLNNPHPGVVCDGCDESINGIRYKCTVCPGFDLCATCEVKLNHPLSHDMLCIKKPIHTPGYVRGSKTHARTVPLSGYTCPLKLFEEVSRSMENDVEPGVMSENFHTVTKNIAAGFGLDPDVALMHVQTFFNQIHHHTKSQDNAGKDDPNDDVEQKDIKVDHMNDGLDLSNNSGIDESFLQSSNEIMLSDEAATQINEELNLLETSGMNELNIQPTCEKELSKDVASKACEVKECDERDSDVNERNKMESQSAAGAIPRKPTIAIPADDTNAIPFTSQLSKDSEISNEQLKSLGQVIGSVMQDIGSHFSSMSSNSGEFKELTCQAENTSPDGFLLVHNKNKESEKAEENVLETKLNDSVQQMKAMGFEFDVEWLKQLLRSKNLNINEVLDLDIFQNSHRV